MHSCKSYSLETSINTPAKPKSIKGHNSTKIWRKITNIELDLYLIGIYFLQSLNKINASLQKLLSVNKTCHDDDAADDDDDVDGQHDPYVFAMLRRQTKMKSSAVDAIQML